MVEELDLTKPWLWEPPADGYIGKKGLPRKDGTEKASGKAVYARDITRPGMLYGKQLLSPYAHAKIKSIDYSKAEALPGVWTILKWDDPDIKDIEVFSGFPRENRWFEVIETEALRDQAPVGPVVIAETEQICDEAIRLIEIEWEELPFILDPEAALASGATILRPDKNPDNNIELEVTTDVGSVEAGFAEADNIIEFTINHKDENSFPDVEGAACVAEFRGDYLYLWGHSQHPQEMFYAPVRLLKLGLKSNQIYYEEPYQGGIFGGPTFIQHHTINCLLATTAAKRTEIGRASCRERVFRAV
jgi:xanthine dehydrogenase molybdenum-binding subunit